MEKVSYTEGGKGKGDEWKYGFIIEERNRQRHFRVRSTNQNISIVMQCFHERKKKE